MGCGVQYPKSTHEQDQIVGILTKLDKKIKVMRKKRRTIQSLFRILLHQLMTAQIRVNDIDLSELGIVDDEYENAGVENA